jgi:hypothetical protein
MCRDVKQFNLGELVNAFLPMASSHGHGADGIYDPTRQASATERLHSFMFMAILARKESYYTDE